MDIALLIGLMIKHYIFDYFVQTRYQFKDKHIYGGDGGMLHAGLHGIGSFIVLWSAGVGIWPALAVGFLLDTFLHYHVDYIKSSSLATANPPLTPNDHQYWIMHGIDQGAHFATYVLMCWLLVAF
jgi:hypothetical protein